MRVGNDLDGCYDSFGDGVEDTLQARGLGHLWKSGPTPAPFWDFYSDWSNNDGSRWNFEQFKELVDWGVDHGYIFMGNWRPGAIEAFGRIARLGHEIIIATDRFFGSNPVNSHRNTVEGLQRAGIEYDELHFTRDKTTVPMDIMVEDKLENYDALVAHGVRTYLINRPWNQVPGGDRRNRIDSVLDYAEEVERITADGFYDLHLV
jgi:hypothetical protein